LIFHECHTSARTSDCAWFWIEMLLLPWFHVLLSLNHGTSHLYLLDIYRSASNCDGSSSHVVRCDILLAAVATGQLWFSLFYLYFSSLPWLRTHGFSMIFRDA
jgi:hypothetical protein